MITEEPLHYFYRKEGFKKENIQSISVGEKYTAILLKNGNIGLCANLQIDVPANVLLNEDLDLTNLAHRIAYNAYLNATFNYANEYESSLDIFDHINFSKKTNIVMVGYFKPLVQKFVAKEINLHIFDKVEKDDILSPIKKMDQYVKNASTLIITSTTIYNNTFLDVIKHTQPGCDVFMLGPSSILHPDMKCYKNIKQIYGAVFETNDDRVLKTIEQDHGTRTFLPFGKKVYI